MFTYMANGHQAGKLPIRWFRKTVINLKNVDCFVAKDHIFLWVSFIVNVIIMTSKLRLAIGGMTFLLSERLIRCRTLLSVVVILSCRNFSLSTCQQSIVPVIILHPLILNFATWSWFLFHERHRRRPITHFEENLSWLLNNCSIQISFVDGSRYLR